MSNDYFKAQGWFKNYARSSQDSRGMFQRLVKEDEEAFRLASAESDKIKALINRKFGPGTLKYGSEIPQPPARPEVIEMDLFNQFMKRNPAADGGQMVKPSADGSRPGYSGKAVKGFDNVFESSPGSKTYVYRRGKKENEIYRGGFDTPEAASKWGKKEFVKKFALPKKFVSASELTALLDVGTGEGSGMRSPFFERGDRPNYLLKEARKILGSYQAGKSNFFKAPTKKQIDYLKKYSKAPLITEGLAKNVQIILDSKAIMNDLSGKNKGGAKLPEFNKVVQVFKNAGVNASDAQITNALQKAAYLLRGDTFQTDVKFNVDKNTGKFVLKELENLPFDNQYARGIYKHALNEIRLELGDTAGNLESFKRNLRKRLPDGFLQKHGLEINEIFSVRASFKNKSFPYAYFIDATDAELNKKALRSFHGALSNAQKNLNNKITDIRAGKAKYDEAVKIVEDFQKTRSKFKNTIETNYPGKNFNLADIVLGKESEVLKKNMKIPEDVYSKKLLDKWKDQGLDITGHAKKTGYVMTGADNPGVFTAQDLSRDKTSRNLFIKEIESYITDTTGKVKQPMFSSGFAGAYEMLSDDLKKITNTEGFKKFSKIAKTPGKFFGIGDVVLGYLDYENNLGKYGDDERGKALSLEYAKQAMSFGLWKTGDKKYLKQLKNTYIKNGGDESVFDQVINLNKQNSELMSLVEKTKEQYQRESENEKIYGTAGGPEAIKFQLSVPSASDTLKTNLSAIKAKAENMDKDFTTFTETYKGTDLTQPSKDIKAAAFEDLAAQKRKVFDTQSRQVNTEAGPIGNKLFNSIFTKDSYKKLLPQNWVSTLNQMIPFMPYKPVTEKEKEQAYIDEMAKNYPQELYRYNLERGVDPDNPITFDASLNLMSKPELGFSVPKAEGGITTLRSKYEYKK